VPEHPVIEAANTFRAMLLKRERAAAMRLVNEYGTIYARLQGQIAALATEIAGMENPTAAKVMRMARYKSLLAQIEAELSRYGAWADTEIGISSRLAIADGLTHAQQLVLAGVPGPLQGAVTAAWNRLPAEAVEALMGFLAPGAPLHEALVTQLGPALAKSVGDKLLEGIALGFNPRKVAAIIRRELGQGLTWALRTARTAQLWAYREATRASYVANQDIVGSWIWHAELGPRTCMACVAQHGTEHPNTETLNDHHNGRCAMIPKTKTWAELGFTGIPDTNPKITSGKDWFNGLPEAQQRAMFGNDAMYRAWQDGAIGWDDLVGTHSSPVYGDMIVLPSLKAMLGDGAKEYYQ